MRTGEKTRAGDEQFCRHLRLILRLISKINMSMTMVLVTMLVRLMMMVLRLVTMVMRTMTKATKSSFRFRIEPE